MQDMLVNLLKLPSCSELEKELVEKYDIYIRRAMVPDLFTILDYVEKTCGIGQKGEAAVCFSNKPVSMLIATHKDKIVGFSCYESTAKAFFGPTYVDDSQRGRGVGKVLLIKALEELRNLGYVYGIIGGVGPIPFYEKCVGATLIPDSNPGFYKDHLPLLK